MVTIVTMVTIITMVTRVTLVTMVTMITMVTVWLLWLLWLHGDLVFVTLHVLYDLTDRFSQAQSVYITTKLYT